MSQERIGTIRNNALKPIFHKALAKAGRFL